MRFQPIHPHDVDKIGRMLRLFHRLGRDQKCSRMYSDGARFEVRHFGLQFLPVVVHAPAERRDPRKARFHQHNLERRKALE